MCDESDWRVDSDGDTCVGGVAPLALLILVPTRRLCPVSVAFATRGPDGKSEKKKKKRVPETSEALQTTRRDVDDVTVQTAVTINDLLRVCRAVEYLMSRARNSMRNAFFCWVTFDCTFKEYKLFKKQTHIYIYISIHIERSTFFIFRKFVLALVVGYFWSVLYILVLNTTL